MTVLACQCVLVIRKQLKEYKKEPICLRWGTSRDVLSVQQRITFKFKQRNGKTLHIRKATVPDPSLQKIYDVLNISATPGGMQRLIISPK